MPLDPSMESVITPVTGGKSDVEPIRYGDYVMERLNKNYSYRHKAATG